MENRIEKLQLFFNRIKGLTIWQRLFGWRALRELSYEAYEEFKSLWAITDSYDKDAQQSSKAIASMETKKPSCSLSERARGTFNGPTPLMWKWTRTD